MVNHILRLVYDMTLVDELCCVSYDAVDMQSNAGIEFLCSQHMSVCMLVSLCLVNLAQDNICIVCTIVSLVLLNF